VKRLLTLAPVIGPIELPSTMFFPAVLFAAWFGGLRVGALAVGFSTLAADYRFAEPVASFLIVNRKDQIELLIFVMAGFGVALLSQSQRLALERATQAENAEREQRQSLEITLNAASVGLTRLSRDLRCLPANPAYAGAPFRTCFIRRFLMSLALPLRRDRTSMVFSTNSSAPPHLERSSSQGSNARLHERLGRTEPLFSCRLLDSQRFAWIHRCRAARGQVACQGCCGNEAK
jgi:PAS domain-containing protein